MFDDEHEVDPDDIIRALGKDGWSFTDVPQQFVCGHCGTDTTPALGLRNVWSVTARQIGCPQTREIRICTNCLVATTFVDNRQIPRPLQGEPFETKHQSEDVEMIVILYDQARYAIRVGAASCAVLMFRKLLMHIAVEQRADEGMKFGDYCDYLKSEAVVGKPQHAVLDRIRKAGNEENHEIRSAAGEEADDLLDMVSVLIKTIYFMK